MEVDRVMAEEQKETSVRTKNNKDCFSNLVEGTLHASDWQTTYEMISGLHSVGYVADQRRAR